MPNIHDQAYDLRRLARDCTPPSSTLPSNRPAMILITSGQGGVGTTTLATNLATALSRRTQRVLLVDVNSHLLTDFPQQGHSADLVLVDAGNGFQGTIQQYWQSADLALVVTTPETTSIMNAYALIKSQANPKQWLPIYGLVNRADNHESAEKVYAQLRQGCQRFLGISLQNAGWIPSDPQIAAPDSRAALHLEHVAERLQDWLVNHRALGKRRSA